MFDPREEYDVTFNLGRLPRRVAELRTPPTFWRIVVALVHHGPLISISIRNLAKVSGVAFLTALTNVRLGERLGMWIIERSSKRHAYMLQPSPHWAYFRKRRTRSDSFGDYTVMPTKKRKPLVTPENKQLSAAPENKAQKPTKRRGKS